MPTLPSAQATASWWQRFFSSSPSSSISETKAATPSWYSGIQSYVQPMGNATWTARDYPKFAEEAYRKNVVANRAMGMIASGAASIDVLAYEMDGTEVLNHPISNLLARPNPRQSYAGFIETLVHYYLLSGNAYVQAVGIAGERPRELHVLRPDRVQVIAGQYGMPKAYRYKVGDHEALFPVHPAHGASRIMHLRNFHPLSDWYGMAPIEAAAYSIDQHNQAAVWNQALLQNGARPSGALMVRMSEGQGGKLTEEQYYRLKQQIEDQFSGANNAGRPLLLEGGLEWKEMSLSPRDMDFLNIKHSSARDIALAFGVPPQLLGIAGDSTYSNLAEARLSLWEQTILPLQKRVLDELSMWLNPIFGSSIQLKIDMDSIPALTAKRDHLWQQVSNADFLSTAEKREILGFDPVMEEDHA